MQATAPVGMEFSTVTVIVSPLRLWLVECGFALFDFGLAPRPNDLMLYRTTSPAIAKRMMANSFKHGFPDGQGGEVRVTLQQFKVTPANKQLNQVRLVVSDTGVGLPADFELQRSPSLGLQLVSDLAAQLGGELQISPGPGVAFSVIFSITNSK